ncbi:Conserved_hypothetical protein [Hexamita inflata]|uniref:Uncharacterized protein n=1 Tax=Hexamita inflata TaxID=28002 RepID=A0AA86RU52_9EUKA|nr:Conserved hypothetical protein [Hexamita inflata]
MNIKSCNETNIRKRQQLLNALDDQMSCSMLNLIPDYNSVMIRRSRLGPFSATNIQVEKKRKLSGNVQFDGQFSALLDLTQQSNLFDSIQCNISKASQSCSYSVLNLKRHQKYQICAQISNQDLKTNSVTTSFNKFAPNFVSTVSASASNISSITESANRIQLKVDSKYKSLQLGGQYSILDVKREKSFREGTPDQSFDENAMKYVHCIESVFRFNKLFNIQWFQVQTKLDLMTRFQTEDLNTLQEQQTIDTVKEPIQLQNVILKSLIMLKVNLGRIINTKNTTIRNIIQQINILFGAQMVNGDTEQKAAFVGVGNDMFQFIVMENGKVKVKFGIE